MGLSVRSPIPYPLFLQPSNCIDPCARPPKNVDFRVDAQNIFNHPAPSNSYYVRNARFTILYNPNFAMNGADPFGYISAKGGHRTFQAKIRVSF